MWYDRTLNCAGVAPTDFRLLSCCSRQIKRLSKHAVANADLCPLYIVDRSSRMLQVVSGRMLHDWPSCVSPSVFLSLFLSLPPSPYLSLSLSLTLFLSFLTLSLSPSLSFSLSLSLPLYLPLLSPSSLSLYISPLSPSLPPSLPLYLSNLNYFLCTFLFLYVLSYQSHISLVLSCPCSQCLLYMLYIMLCLDVFVFLKCTQTSGELYTGVRSCYI